MKIHLAIFLLNKYEEGLFAFTVVAMILLVAIWIIYNIAKSMQNSFYKLLRKPPKISQLDKLLHDKNFVSDLTNIIEDEGGIFKFMDKLRPLFRHDDWDHNQIWSVRSFSFKNVAGIYARPIIEKIIETEGFKNFLEKEKIRSSEIESFANGLWIVLSQHSFKKIYREMLIATGMDTHFADREMTDEEKKEYFNID